MHDLDDLDRPLGREEESGSYGILTGGIPWRGVGWFLLALSIGGWASLVWVYVRHRPRPEKIIAWIVSIIQLGLFIGLGGLWIMPSW